MTTTTTTNPPPPKPPLYKTTLGPQYDIILRENMIARGLAHQMIADSLNPSPQGPSLEGFNKLFDQTNPSSHVFTVVERVDYFRINRDIIGMMDREVRAWREGIDGGRRGRRDEGKEGKVEAEKVQRRHKKSFSISTIDMTRKKPSFCQVELQKIKPPTREHSTTHPNALTRASTDRIVLKPKVKKSKEYLDIEKTLSSEIRVVRNLLKPLTLNSQEQRKIQEDRLREMREHNRLIGTQTGITMANHRKNSQRLFEEFKEQIRETDSDLCSSILT